jgi:hypothetical protein
MSPLPEVHRMGIDAINFLLELQLIEPEMTGVQPPHLIREIRPVGCPRCAKHACRAPPRTGPRV